MYSCNLTFRVFWDVMLCHVVNSDISEEHATYIFMVQQLSFGLNSSSALLWELTSHNIVMCLLFQMLMHFLDQFELPYRSSSFITIFCLFSSACLLSNGHLINIFIFDASKPLIKTHLYQLRYFTWRFCQMFVLLLLHFLLLHRDLTLTLCYLYTSPISVTVFPHIAVYVH